MEVNRRDFIKDLGLAGAVALSGISVARCASTKEKGSMKSKANRVDEPTYKQFVVGDIPRYDATNNAFSRITYDPDYGKVRGRQMKNMKGCWSHRGASSQNIVLNDFSKLPGKTPTAPSKQERCLVTGTPKSRSSPQRAPLVLLWIVIRLALNPILLL